MSFDSDTSLFNEELEASWSCPKKLLIPDSLFVVVSEMVAVVVVVIVLIVVELVEVEVKTVVVVVGKLVKI